MKAWTCAVRRKEVVLCKQMFHIIDRVTKATDRGEHDLLDEHKEWIKGGEL